jgi:rhamnosyltransferase
MSAHICSVVTTYRPGHGVMQNLAALRRQTKGLVVVDDGSPLECVSILQAASIDMGFQLILNVKNLGIAAALNKGVRWAKAQGFQYVALFDQDSTVTDGFIPAILAEYDSHPHRRNLALVTPCQVNRNDGRTRVHGCAEDGGPLVAITSGSLMPIEIFERCGWFEEGLIIDCVDHEYCLRARSLGYTLAECRKAVLLVAVGATTCHRAFGLEINATHHSAKRRYYMTRNRLVMVRRFWKRQPGWCFRTIRDVLQSTINLTLVEDERWNKLTHTARGVYDALCGRMGKVVEL